MQEGFDEAGRQDPGTAGWTSRPEPGAAAPRAGGEREPIYHAEGRLDEGEKARWLRIYAFASLRYLFTTEVHAYAFSIAANALLAFFPFTMLLLIVCRSLLHWQGGYLAILALVRANLPAGADFVIRNLEALAYARRRVEVASVAALLFTSSGVFLPLEIALNRVWRFSRNRTFLRNVALSFLLAVATGLVAMLFVVCAAGVSSAVQFAFGWILAPDVVAGAKRVFLDVLSVPLVIAIYFVLYYVLPNGRVRARRLLPAAVLAGLVTAVAKFIYVLTLPLLRFREVYGPFSISIALLFWAYVGAVILLWGAHLSAQDFWERLLPPTPAVAPLRIADATRGPSA